MSWLRQTTVNTVNTDIRIIQSKSTNKHITLISLSRFEIDILHFSFYFKWNFGMTDCWITAEVLSFLAEGMKWTGVVILY